MRDGAGEIASIDDAASLHPVAGGGVIFNAREGRLYALSPVAGLTWLCLKDGLSPAKCVVAISKAFDVQPSVAAEWFSKGVEMFKNVGLLGSTKLAQSEDTRREKKVVEGARPQLSRRGSGVLYQLLEKEFSIAAPSELHSVIDSLLTNLRIEPTARGGPQFLHIDVAPRDGSWDISVGGRTEISCSTGSVAAEIERLLVKAVVAATPHLLTFHAAAAQRGGRSFLLAGESGTGKTTLSLALERAGWDYGSDEIVLLSRDLRLRPLPLPPCIKSNIFSTIATWYPQLRWVPEHDRYGKRIKYLPVRSARFDATSGFVVFPHYDRDGGNELQPLESFVGLQKLLAQCVFAPPGFQNNDVRLLLEWHSRQRYFEVRYSHCDFAVAFLRNIEGKK